LIGLQAGGIKKNERRKKNRKNIKNFRRNLGKNSDQRFGQLLINLGVIKNDFETWRNEDDLLEEHLTKIKETGLKWDIK